MLIKESSYPAFRVLEHGLPFRRTWARWRRRAFCQAQHTAAAQSLREQGVPSDHVWVVPNGLALPDPASREEDSRSLLCVSNFYQGLEDKGLDVLLAALASMDRARADPRLLLAGDGDPGPVMRHAGSLGCEDRLELLGRVADMGALYRRAAVVVVPSRREGMSNVLLEAMSWGIPVVASDIPGNRAVLDDPSLGLLVPCGDRHAMAEALHRLLADRDLRNRIGSAARSRIAAAYEIQKVAARLREVYLHLLSLSPARRES